MNPHPNTILESLRRQVFNTGLTFVNTGEKLRIKKLVRSQKTGMVLPNEGTLVCVTAAGFSSLLFQMAILNTFSMTKSSALYLILSLILMSRWLCASIPGRFRVGNFNNEDTQ
jgi:hypothetical protein